MLNSSIHDGMNSGPYGDSDSILSSPRRHFINTGARKGPIKDIKDKTTLI